MRLWLCTTYPCPQVPNDVFPDDLNQYMCKSNEVMMRSLRFLVGASLMGIVFYSCVFSLRSDSLGHDFLCRRRRSQYLSSA